MNTHILFEGLILAYNDFLELPVIVCPAMIWQNKIFSSTTALEALFYQDSVNHRFLALGSMFLK